MKKYVDKFTKRRTDWVKAFLEKWQAKDVACWIYLSLDSFVLNELRIPEKLRNQGIGSCFMNELIAFADRYQVILRLTPSLCYGASSIERLEDFYRRFGFRKKRNDMIRNPKR